MVIKKREIYYKDGKERHIAVLKRNDNGFQVHCEKCGHPLTWSHVKADNAWSEAIRRRHTKSTCDQVLQGKF